MAPQPVPEPCRTTLSRSLRRHPRMPPEVNHPPGSAPCLTRPPRRRRRRPRSTLRKEPPARTASPTASRPPTLRLAGDVNPACEQCAPGGATWQELGAKSPRCPRSFLDDPQRCRGNPVITHSPTATYPQPRAIGGSRRPSGGCPLTPRVAPGGSSGRRGSQTAATWWRCDHRC